MSARSSLALRTGVASAAASISGSFARGLLPRSATDQALTTGASAAIRLGTGVLGLAAAEELIGLLVERSGRGSVETATMLSSAAYAAGALAVVKAIPDSHEVPLAMATLRSGAYLTGAGAGCAALVIAADKAARPLIGEPNPWVGVLLATAAGTGVSVVNMWRRERRATAMGEDRHGQIQKPKGAIAAARATGMGILGGASLLALAGVEYAIAEGTSRAIDAVAGRDIRSSGILGHAAAMGALGAVGVYALNTVRKRVERGDDIVEPAYPHPPTSPHVTAGPESSIAFDTIGKEGRRFVVMTLTPEEIEAVMGEPAMAPVRVVAGYEAADSLEERAALALQDLERLGAYERSVICVASPTGVGYVNYSFAEALEYLTRGSCAIVSTQYALVPSALALGQVHEGARLQTLVLEGLAQRIAGMPEDARPRVVQFGESLGAEVALDIAGRTTGDFDALGIHSGLYLGTPFRTSLWQRWVADPAAVDPGGILGQVSQADEIGTVTGPAVRHVQIVHHDDPINKFAYDGAVRTPWWMGPPEQRPPLVPRETRFRPFTTFIINVVDLKNGMNSKPGEFVRLGHDYRIELREAVQRTYGLTATAEQAERIEQALRDREREWAARRFISRRFAKARTAVLTQLKTWGVDIDAIDAETLEELASGDVSGLARALGSAGAT